METTIEKRQRIISLYIVHTSMFVFALGNSVIMMGVWPYLQAVRKFHYILAFRKTLIKPYLINNSTLEKYTIIQLDSSTTMSQYGFIVATDALAQLLFAPVFGALADKLGTIRPVAITCSVIFTSGNLLYSMISLVPQTFGSLKCRCRHQKFPRRKPQRLKSLKSINVI